MKVLILSSGNGTVFRGLFPEFRGLIQAFATNNPEAPALAFAKEQGLKTLVFHPKAEEEALIAFAQDYDYIFLLGYMRIVSEKTLQSVKAPFLNIHPSLLPDFAGGMDTDVHAQVLEAGVATTGATLHYVTADLDAGPIFSQKSCPVLEGDTPQTLKARVQALEVELVREALLFFQKPLV